MGDWSNMGSRYSVGVNCDRQRSVRDTLHAPANCGIPEFQAPEWNIAPALSGASSFWVNPLYEEAAWKLTQQYPQMTRSEAAVYTAMDRICGIRGEFTATGRLKSVRYGKELPTWCADAPEAGDSHDLLFRQRLHQNETTKGNIAAQYSDNAPAEQDTAPATSKRKCSEERLLESSALLATDFCLQFHPASMYPKLDKKPREQDNLVSSPRTAVLESVDMDAVRQIQRTVLRWGLKRYGPLLVVIQWKFNELGSMLAHLFLLPAAVQKANGTLYSAFDELRQALVKPDDGGRLALALPGIKNGRLGCLAIVESLIEAMAAVGLCHSKREGIKPGAAGKDKHAIQAKEQEERVLADMESRTVQTQKKAEELLAALEEKTAMQKKVLEDLLSQTDAAEKCRETALRKAREAEKKASRAADAAKDAERERQRTVRLLQDTEKYFEQVLLDIKGKFFHTEKFDAGQVFAQHDRLIEARRIHDGLVSGLDPNIRDKIGQTALHKATILGLTEAVQLLLDSGADLEAKDALGMTALDYAQQASDKELTEILLRAGATDHMQQPDTTPDPSAIRQ